MLSSIYGFAEIEITLLSFAPSCSKLVHNEWWDSTLQFFGDRKFIYKSYVIRSIGPIGNVSHKLAVLGLW